MNTPEFDLSWNIWNVAGLSAFMAGGRAHSVDLQVVSSYIDRQKLYFNGLIRLIEYGRCFFVQLFAHIFKWLLVMRW